MDSEAGCSISSFLKGVQNSKKKMQKCKYLPNDIIVGNYFLMTSKLSNLRFIDDKKF